MSLTKLEHDIVAFRDARDWKQFHNPKDLALSLTLEATEVMEHFQWKNGEEITVYAAENREAIAGELADVLYWTILLSHELGIDLEAAFAAKMQENQEKYPVAKAKGKATKYTKL